MGVEGRAGSDRRAVYLPGPDVFGPLAPALEAWTVRLGHAVVGAAERSAAHLEVLPAGLGLDRAGARWIAVSTHRSTPPSPGAAASLCGHHGPLDLAFVYAEHLFGSRSEQRRYGLRHGRLEVELDPRRDDVAPIRGRLVGLNRCGAWVEAAAAIAEGEVLELGFPDDILGEGVRPGRCRLLGRVMTPDPTGRLVGIELMLEACEGFPTFRSLARRLSSRAASPA